MNSPISFEYCFTFWKNRTESRPNIFFFEVLSDFSLPNPCFQLVILSTSNQIHSRSTIFHLEHLVTFLFGIGSNKPSSYFLQKCVQFGNSSLTKKWTLASEPSDSRNISVVQLVSRSLISTPIFLRYNSPSYTDLELASCRCQTEFIPARGYFLLSFG